MKVQASICFLVLMRVIGSSALIIPDEIPSVLSLIYSNIPTLKKGTDSRIGWGFRLGDRADFQFLTEIGPQTNTQPLANQGTDTNRKRNVGVNRINNLYALYHDNRKAQQEAVPNTEGGRWIKEWSQNTGKPITEKFVPSENVLKPKPGLAIGEIDAKSVIPDDSIIKLTELYRKHPKEVLEVLETLAKYATAKPTTQEALDNVSVE